MAARGDPTWAGIPTMAPPPLGTERELPALAAVVAILDHLTEEERDRVLGYLMSRYRPKVTMGEDEP